MVQTKIHAEWRGELRFESGTEGGPTAIFDGDGHDGQSPVQALLTAIATCSGADVVEILRKRRTPPERMVVDVVATRRAEAPRRVIRLDVDYVVDGEGIDAGQVERAIALSIEKYCSVVTSLNPDIDLYVTATVNGAAGRPARIPVVSPPAGAAG